MADDRRFSGVLAPVVTPFAADLAPDAGRLVRLCRWLVRQGSALAVFGTTSEGNSLSVDEKIELLDALVEGGVSPDDLMPGTGQCAIPDTVRLTAHAVRLRCRGVLMLPPFYYKAVGEDGLFRSFAEVIERVGDSRLRVYLYHIPPVAQVGLSPELIDRLVAAYPDTVAGIKDSSGDWANTAAMLARGWPDFRVFVGSETFLLANLRGGGAGAISATVNVNPAAVADLFAHWREPDAEARQSALTDFRHAMEQFPMIPALKQVIAHLAADAGWATVRPPLEPLTAQRNGALVRMIDERGLAMPGLLETAG